MELISLLNNEAINHIGEDFAIPDYVKCRDENSMILRTSLEGIITYASPSAVNVLGFKPSMLTGKSVYEFIHPEDSTDLFASLKSGEIEIATFTFRVLHSDGHFIWMETTATVKKAPWTKKPIEILSISHDISKKKKKYDQIGDMQELSGIGQLAAGFAHEIHNPLTTIKGFLQLMETESIINRDYLLLMLGEIKRIEDITKDLMILGKPSKSSEFKVLNLIQILRDVMFILKSEAANNNVKFLLKNCENHIEFEFDETKIKQVFINIIKNGIEAMSEKGGIMTIEVSLVKNKNKIKVAISDEGNGILDTDLKKIGTPFYTTKMTGNGLGLMMCYKIIEEYNGKIAIDSKINEGTTFMIEIPQWRGNCFVPLK